MASSLLRLAALALAVFCLGVLNTYTQAAANSMFLAVKRVGHQLTTREGCREVFTCTRVGERSEWTKIGGLDDAVKVTSTNSSSSDGVVTWKTSLVLDPVTSGDAGKYRCGRDEGGQRQLEVILGVKEGVAAFVDVHDISLSNYDYEEDLEVLCRVETCIPDMVVQLFREEQLIDMETVEEENQFVGYATIKAKEEMVGEYVCQAMSEMYNEVFRQRFSIAGIPRRPSK